MDPISEFSKAVDQLETMLRQSSNFPAASSPEQLKEALSLRRGIAELNAKIATFGERAFSDEAKRVQFRHQAASLRTKIASHLSAWPVSGIIAADPDYQSSLQRLRAAYKDFIAWTRRELQIATRGG